MAASRAQLLSAHHEVFVAASRPTLPTPNWATPAQFIEGAERHHLSGVGRFDRSAREQARAAARADADTAANQTNAGLQAQWQTAQADADRWWAQLTSNDEDVVLGNVNAAFADNESPAVALGVDGASLTVLMIQPPVEEFGDRKPKLTPAGNWSIGAMTKTEQRQQWTSCTVSRSVAAIAEAFAVAPGIDQVDLVVASRPVAARRYQLVLAGGVRRDAFQRMSWPAAVQVRDLLPVGTFAHRIDRFGALTDAATDVDPELRALVQTLNNVIDTEDGTNDDHPDTGRSGPPAPQVAPPEPKPAPKPEPRPEAHGRDLRSGGSFDRAAAPPSPGRAFMLWGSPPDWCNLDIVGTSYREADVLALLPRPGREGAERFTTCQLVPDVGNPHDHNAIGCWIDGRHVGYLPRDDAARYVGPLRELLAAGEVPTTRARVWAGEVDTWNDERGVSTASYRTSVRVALGEPNDLVPANRLPAKPRVLLPSGWPLKVSNTKDHMSTLVNALGGRPECWVYATLAPVTVVTPRSTKTQVQVLVDGRQIGTLSSQMTAAYLDLVEPLDRAGWKPMVQTRLHGNSIAVIAEVHVARTHELAPQWVHDMEDAARVPLRLSGS